MPRTTVVDGHDHEYQDINGRHVTSMDGTSPHLHLALPFPATQTSVTNGHSHGMPGRMPDAGPSTKEETQEEAQKEEA